MLLISNKRLVPLGLKGLYIFRLPQMSGVGSLSSSQHTVLTSVQEVAACLHHSPGPLPRPKEQTGAREKSSVGQILGSPHPHITLITAAQRHQICLEIKWTPHYK